MTGKRKLFYGWWIALVTAIVGFFAGGTYFYGFTVYFNPIRDTFHWTAAVTSVAFSFQRLEAGILGPLAGFLVDRLGSRKLMLFGWSIVGLGFVLMSRVNSLWAFYGTFLIIAGGMSFAHSVVPSAAIANWFIKKRSRALSFMYAGYGACGILAPILALSITNFGWRTTLAITGVGLWAICLPLCLVMRHEPRRYGYLPDGEDKTAGSDLPNTSNTRSSANTGNNPKVIASDFSVKEALKTKAFWLLSMVFFFQHVGTSAVMVHIVPYLESIQVPTEVAATAVTGITLSSLAGRLGFGILGDFANKRYLIAIALAFQAVGLLILSFMDSGSVWLIIPFLLTYAPGYGGPVPLKLAVQADYFGTRRFGTIMGLMSTISMVGGLSSPIVAGWIFDVTGSYHSAWQLFTLATVPAIPLMLLAKSPPVRQGLLSGASSGR